MSYLIRAVRSTKAELEIAIRDELSKVPVSQPVHEVDMDQAFNAAKSLLDLMQDDPARDIRGSVSGSIWKNEDGVQEISLGINFQYSARQVTT